MTIPQTPMLYGAFGAYLLAVLMYLSHLVLRRPWVWRSAFVLVLAGFAVQSVFLAMRWATAGYLPVTNLFATQFFFSWALAATRNISLGILPVFGGHPPKNYQKFTEKSPQNPQKIIKKVKYNYCLFTFTFLKIYPKAYGSSSWL